ncbi:MAG: hypothetical protein ACE5G5_09240 [Candidatus Methylomirabilales bacterium]
MNLDTLLPQVKEGNPIRKWCLAGSLLIVLSLFTYGPAFAAEFEKTFDEVRIEGEAPGVEITILDYFGHPVESAVVRLVEGRTTYQVKYNSLFKVQVRDLTERELYKVEREAAKRRAEELERARRQRWLRR